MNFTHSCAFDDRDPDLADNTTDTIILIYIGNQDTYIHKELEISEICRQSHYLSFLFLEK